MVKKKSQSKQKARKPRGQQVSGTQSGPVMAMVGVGRVPSFLRSNDDVIHAKFGGVFVAQNRTFGLASYLVMLNTNNTITDGYIGLGSICAGIYSFGGLYSKFMIGNLKVNVKGISPITSQGYAIVNYEPDSSGISNPPTAVGDVSNARHKCVATPAVEAGFSVQVHSYYNDWRQTVKDSSGTSDSESQCGVLQVLGSNLGEVDAPVVMMEIELDAWFTGYRKL
jgi:hypothetical protein